MNMRLLTLLVVTSAVASASGVQVTATSGNGFLAQNVTCYNSAAALAACSAVGQYGSADVQGRLESGRKFFGVNPTDQAYIDLNGQGDTLTRPDSILGSSFSSTAVIEIPGNWGDVRFTSGPIYYSDQFNTNVAMDYGGQNLSLSPCQDYGNDYLGNSYYYYSCTLQHSFGQEIPLSLTFAASDGGNDGVSYPYVFDFTFSPVPEPATLALIGFPAVLLGINFIRRGRLQRRTS